MPMHRRRVYLEHGATRRARMEGLLTLSIFLSTAILMLSLIVCLPDIISSTLGWLQAERPSYGFGTLSVTQPASVLVVMCEILTVIAGGYLAVALFVRSR